MAEPTTPPTKTRWTRWVTLAGVVIAIATGVAIRDQFSREALVVWLNELGLWAGVAFTAGYAVGAVACLPGLVFTLTAGALFGPVWGTLYSVTGATAGAGLAFLAARHGLAHWVTRRTGTRLERLQAGIDREGWRFVALMRLIPLVPFNLLNYALGLTRIRFVTYLITSLVAMLPGAFAYVWLGHAGRQAIAGGDNVLQSVIIAIALIAAVAFLPRLIRSVRGGGTDKEMG